MRSVYVIERVGVTVAVELGSNMVGYATMRSLASSAFRHGSRGNTVEAVINALRAVGDAWRGVAGEVPSVLGCSCVGGWRD